MKAWLWPVAAAGLTLALSGLAACSPYGSCVMGDDGICRQPMQATPLDPYAQQRRQRMPDNRS